MSANEFDELIQHKFDETDIAFNPGNWERMSEQLNKVQQPNKNSIFFFSWPALSAIAAAIALLVALPVLWLQNSNISEENIIANTTDIHHTLPAQPQQGITLTANTQNEPSTEAKGPNASVKHTQCITKPTQKTITPQSNENAEPEVALNNRADNAAQPIAKQRTELPKQKILLSDPAIETRQSTIARTSINLIGGFNYNAASAGFMVGASANRNLNDKLYLEGNLAYVNSSVGGNSPFGNSNSFADQFDASPGATTGQAKAPEPVQYNLSYLQFSPVLGYHVSERFTLSVGPDLQQLLNTENYYIQDLPSLDMGVLGKAEYGITEKLKAGLQYRAGVNNVVQGKNYTERNYMQVQVRYSIFHK
jgi:hypothetical protein